MGIARALLGSASKMQQREMLLAEDEKGETPLTWAAGKGHEAVVTSLLDGASGSLPHSMPLTRDRHGRRSILAKSIRLDTGNDHEATARALIKYLRPDPSSSPPVRHK